MHYTEKILKRARGGIAGRNILKSQFDSRLYSIGVIDITDRLNPITVAVIEATLTQTHTNTMAMDDNQLYIGLFGKQQFSF